MYICKQALENIQLCVYESLNRTLEINKICHNVKAKY